VAISNYFKISLISVPIEIPYYFNSDILSRVLKIRKLVRLFNGASGE